MNIDRSEIITHEKAHSLTVSGILRRTNLNNKEQDFCFSLDVIGEERYLTGAVCRPTKAELEQVEVLFSREPIIWSDR
jgi:hypothetical protein